MKNFSPPSGNETNWVSTRGLLHPRLEHLLSGKKAKSLGEKEVDLLRIASERPSFEALLPSEAFANLFLFPPLQKAGSEKIAPAKSQRVEEGSSRKSMG